MLLDHVNDHIYSLAYSGDGRFLVSVSWGGEAVIRDIETGAYHTLIVDRDVSAVGYRTFLCRRRYRTELIDLSTMETIPLSVPDEATSEEARFNGECFVALGSRNRDDIGLRRADTLILISEDGETEVRSLSLSRRTRWRLSDGGTVVFGSDGDMAAIYGEEAEGGLTIGFASGDYELRRETRIPREALRINPIGETGAFVYQIPMPKPDRGGASTRERARRDSHWFLLLVNGDRFKLDYEEQVSWPSCFPSPDGRHVLMAISLRPPRRIVLELRDLSSGERLWDVDGETMTDRAFAWSRDGTRIFHAGEIAPPGPRCWQGEKLCQVRDPATGEVLSEARQFARPGYVNHFLSGAVAHPSEPRFHMWSDTGLLFEINPNTVRLMDDDIVPIADVLLSADGRHTVAIDASGNACAWEDGTVVDKTTGDTDAESLLPLLMDVSGEGCPNRAPWADQKGTRLYKATRIVWLQDGRLHAQTVRMPEWAASFHASQGRLVTDSGHFWLDMHGAPHSFAGGNRGWSSNMGVVSPDGSKFVIVLPSKRLAIVNAASGDILVESRDPFEQSGPCGLAWSQDQSRIYFTKWGTDLYVLDAATLEIALRIDMIENATVEALDEDTVDEGIFVGGLMEDAYYELLLPTPANTVVFVFGKLADAKAVELATERVWSIGFFDRAVSATVAWSGRCFAAKESTIAVLDFNDGPELGRLELDTGVTSMSTTSDGRTLAVACRDGSVRILDVDSGTEIRRMRAQL